jgi:hypothetical protein
MLNGEDSAFWTHVQIGDSALAAIRGEKLCKALDDSKEAGEFESPADCEPLKWIADNPDSDVIAAAVEYDSAIMGEARELIARERDAIPARCESTPDLFAGEAQ